MPSSKVNVAEYLYTRLKQLGCNSLHGLPGDFNLVALDYVESSGLTWVGNCNELNAGYAADAYARMTGLGAIMTTFGVGELSAVNAIAGSYSEIVPVVHIVGSPPRAAQEDHLFLHHTCGNGDFRVYARIFSEITLAQVNLTDVKQAPTQIDNVLRTCVVESRPVYIELPTDMVQQEVDAALLETPIDVSPHKGDAAKEKDAIDLILKHLYAAKNPAVLVDGVAVRRRIQADVDELIRKLNIPVYVAPMGKGGVDETLPNYVGVYSGTGSDPDVKKAFENSDFVINIGPIASDLNTTGFTMHLPDDTVALHYQYCSVGSQRFQKANLKSLLPSLIDAVDASRLKVSIPSVCHATAKADESDIIAHAWLWPRMSKFFRRVDILVCDTGTSYVGFWATQFPSNVSIINQLLWSSIGYGVGAVQGAALAAKEAGKGQRTICFEGDGSFQLTAQELSTIIRHELDVTMILIENSGYTIERFVHGMEAAYNDIPQWKYSKLPEVLTPEGITHKVKTWRIHSRAAFDQLLDSTDFADGRGLQFVEIHMPKEDAPQVLIDFGVDAAKRAS